MVVLESVVAKVSAAGASRALGWGVKSLKRRIDNQRVQELLDSSLPMDDLASVVAALDASSQRRFAKLLAQPELHQFALALSTHIMLEKTGKPAEVELQGIKKQVQQFLRLSLDLDDKAASDLGAALFTTLKQQVTVSLTALTGGHSELPPTTRAALTKNAACVASASLRNADQLSHLQSLTDYLEFEHSLRDAIQALHGSMRLPHAGTSRQVPYERLFVQPTVRYVDVSEEEHEDESLDLTEILANSARVILLGDPGGGKSTSSLKLTHDIAAGKQSELPATVPFLIVLRDYAEQWNQSRLSVLEYLEQIARTPYGLSAPDGAIDYILLNGRGVVIFDGLDELLDTSQRRTIVQVVEGFANRYPLTPILVTSRRVGYPEAPLDSETFAVAALREFDSEQVEAYVRKWFALDESVEQQRKDQLAEAFLQDSAFVEDLRINPLMLSLMCGIYATENYIPRNRPDVYEKCALLLFDRWDKQRGINVSLSFDAHVQAAMRSLALWLYPRQESQLGLPRQALIDFMKQYLLDKRFDNEVDAEQAAVEFIDFCKGRAWVLSDVGAELYGFTHRTFLEYFAASQLVRQNPGPHQLIETLWEHITLAEWDVVCQLAVQILGKTVEDGADDFLMAVIDRLGETASHDRRAAALDFAARTLQFIVPRPPVLKAIVKAVLVYHCENPPPTEEVVDYGEAMVITSLLNAGQENLPMLSRYLREAIADRLEHNVMDERALALAIYPASYALRRRYAASDIHRSFWNGEIDVYRAQFAPLLDVQSGMYPWAASELFVEGQLSASDVVERVGMGAFYDLTIAGAILRPPVAYRIVGGLFESGSAQDRPFLTAPQLEDLLNVALRTTGPWIDGSKRYSSVMYALNVRRGSPLRDSLAILLALPIAEMFASAWGGEHGLGSGESRREDLEQLLFDYGIPDGRRRLADFQLFPEVSLTLERWLRGELAFSEVQPAH